MTTVGDRLYEMGGVPVGGGPEQIITGDVYFVNSTGGSSGHGGKKPTDAMATLDQAVGKCTANNGDVIYVLAGHAETVAAAGAIAIDVAGVTIIGLGVGADRPTFTFSATAATITMTAASCMLQNIIVKPSIDNVVSPIVVSAADCKVDFECQELSATVQCTSAFLTTAGADRLDLKLKHRGFIAGAGCVNAARLVGVDTARVYVDFYGVASTSIVEFHTTACHDIAITGNFYNDGTSLTKNVVDTVTGSTWSAKGWDGNSQSNFSGGDGVALAGDDVGAVSAAVVVVDTVVDSILVDTGTTLPATLASQSDVDTSATAVMVNGDTLFTIAGGAILVESLVSECVTGNDATASTLQYSATPTVGAATTISGATTTLASVAAGYTISLLGTALSSVPSLSVGGPNLGVTAPVVVPAGIITAVVGVGSTTGTWKHHIRYRPLATGVTVA